MPYFSMVCKLKSRKSLKEIRTAFEEITPQAHRSDKPSNHRRSKSKKPRGNTTVSRFFQFHT